MRKRIVAYLLTVGAIAIILYSVIINNDAWRESFWVVLVPISIAMWIYYGTSYLRSKKNQLYIQDNGVLFYEYYNSSGVSYSTLFFGVSERYYIESVSNYKETRSKFIIYGQIKYTPWYNKTTKIRKKIAIRKMFSNMDILRDYLNDKLQANKT